MLQSSRLSLSCVPSEVRKGETKTHSSSQGGEVIVLANIPVILSYAVQHAFLLHPITPYNNQKKNNMPKRVGTPV